jgi:small-conductance mechanosensitive channel
VTGSITVGRGALTGAIVSAAFAIAWAMWGASGLPDGAAIATRIAAALAGAVLIGAAAVLRRRVPDMVETESMFASSAYRWIVGVEVVALFGGGAVLNATGRSSYTIAWFALVVGVHFLGFGRAFWSGFHAIGAVLVGAGLAGAVVGLAGGSAAHVRAVTGLIAALDLLLASAWTVRRAAATA